MKYVYPAQIYIIKIRKLHKLYINWHHLCIFRECTSRDVYTNVGIIIRPWYKHDAEKWKKKIKTRTDLDTKITCTTFFFWKHFDVFRRLNSSKGGWMVNTVTCFNSVWRMSETTELKSNRTMPDLWENYMYLFWIYTVYSMLPVPRGCFSDMILYIKLYCSLFRFCLIRIIDYKIFVEFRYSD